MTPKTYQTWITILVSAGIAFGGLALARVDRRIDSVEAQATRDTAQDVRIEEQAKQIVAIGEYMSWSTGMLINIALRIGARLETPPILPMVNQLPDKPTAPAPRGAGKR